MREPRVRKGREQVLSGDCSGQDEWAVKPGVVLLGHIKKSELNTVRPTGCY